MDLKLLEIIYQENSEFYSIDRVDDVVHLSTYCTSWLTPNYAVIQETAQRFSLYTKSDLYRDSFEIPQFKKRI